MNKLPIAFALFSFEGSKTKKQILEEIAAFSFNNGLAYNKAFRGATSTRKSGKYNDR